MNALLTAGYPYELAGIAYYVLFMLMSRKRNAATYSLRSRVLVISAAIAMVGCVPFHYAASGLGTIVMIGLAVCALLSTIFDSRLARRR